MIKAIIFDWGGVIVENPGPKQIQYFAEYFQVTQEDFRKANQMFKDTFQRGKISEQNYWQKMSSELNIKEPQVSLWKEALTKIYKENKDMFSLAVSLKKNGYKIGLLSNTEVPTMNFFFEQGYNIFDVTVFSCKEGYTKPDKHIYEIAVNRLGVHPQEAVMIDDRTKNITGAKKAGLQGIVFKGYNSLQQELTSLSVEI